MEDLLSMGAPIYWVLGPGITFNDTSNQNLVCGGTLCNENSVPTQLYIASNYPEM